MKTPCAIVRGSAEHPLAFFAIGTLGFCVLLWGAQILRPTSPAATVVVIVSTVAGAFAVKPGWNLRPVRPNGYWALLGSLVVGSAVTAGWVLRLLKIPLPYGESELRIVPLLTGILAVTGLEELLFRQIAYRWLEKRGVPGRMAVAATALAFGCAHLGPVFRVSAAETTIYLLQSAYLLWIGVLFGEFRRVSSSWLIPWAAHAGYNAIVLLSLSLMS